MNATPKCFTPSKIFPQIFPMLSYNDTPEIGEIIDTPAAEVPHPDILVIPVLIW